MAKNPDWSRDEAILALAFYVMHKKDGISYKKLKDEIDELCKMMRSLVDKTQPHDSTLRKHTGILRNLDNFRKWERGEDNGRRVSRQMKETWQNFEEAELIAIAEAINHNVQDDQELPQVDENFYTVAREGVVLTCVHIRHERSKKIAQLKKEQCRDLNNGKLDCEVCRFDFGYKYPSRGEEYMECHHNRPLSELGEEGAETSLEDLSLLCSNCHRMIHRRQPWLTVQQLRSITSNWWPPGS